MSQQELLVDSPSIKSSVTLLPQSDVFHVMGILSFWLYFKVLKRTEVSILLYVC